MKKRLIIHATNVHQGGGRALLFPLLEALPEHVNVVALLDARMSTPQNMLGKANVQTRRVKPSVMERLKAEWWLRKNVTAGDIVFCFGNLPPIFRLPAKTIVFVQNRYLIEQVSLSHFSLRTRLRLVVERFWFSWKSKNANEFIVQTPSMKSQLKSVLGVNAAVHIVPFLHHVDGYARSLSEQGNKNIIRHDFLYVATGEPHKNHRKLIEAWCLLATEKIFPSLCLTIDEKISVNLCLWMSKQKQLFGLKLHNFGVLPHDQITSLYTQVGALIYPSKFESFGIPLIEARQAGLQVLASELDYVRDVLDPEQSFNPESALSIARAVKRFMALEESQLPLCDAAAFMKTVLEKAK